MDTATSVAGALSPPTHHRISRRPRLGEVLVRRAAVTTAQLETALSNTGAGRRIGEELLRRGSVEPEALARGLAEQLGLPYGGPVLDPEAAALRSVSPELARTSLAVPLTVGERTLRVGMTDPLDVRSIADLEFHTGRRVEPVVVSERALERALADAYGPALDALLEGLPASGAPGEARDLAKSLEREARAQPVVRLVDHLLAQAIEREASDIHLEEGEDRLTVRFRMDGLLRTVMELPPGSRSAVLSRIKIMAGMDIAEKRRAQDGGFVLASGPIPLTFRVSTLPAERGEKAVLRLLDPRGAPGGLEDLGLSDPDLVRFRRLLASRQGLLLIAGPTGSGKSTTLFAALLELDRATQNVVTLEDPIEYRIPGATQVQVNRAAGQTFPTLLRAVLRQDPDILMVGEIRDPETAGIAMAAAVTGHLVLSTIHTVDAPAAVTRLLDMGVPDYLVAGGLIGVVAQRLVRRICERCGGRDPGCERCVAGLRGRTGVFQLLAVTDAIREEITGGAAPSALRRLATLQGSALLIDDARRQIAEGRTTPHEVMRVLQGGAGASLPCRTCDAEVPADAAGCPSCGSPRRRLCACGVPLRRGWRYCPGCLRKVREEPPRGW